MKGFLRRIHRDSKGFTLVELLIVVCILGILAAIVLPNFAGITDRGEDEAGAAELSIVQTAMDVMMAMDRLTTVTEVSVATDDMTGFPIEHPLYPDYLRRATTTGTYTCTENGTVEQATTGYEP